MQVSADQRTEVAIELTPLPGTLAITSRVAGAEVWIGNRKLGETTARPPARARQPAARHLPRESPEAGYQPWEQEVQVSADQRTEVAIELTPLPGTVAITSRVAGAEVWVGNDKLGETPPAARSCATTSRPAATGSKR